MDSAITLTKTGRLKVKRRQHFRYPCIVTEADGWCRFYNGQSLESAKDPKDSRNGIQSPLHCLSTVLEFWCLADFADHPITSRAHLLDIPRYLAKNNLHPLVNLTHETPVDADILEACAQYQGVTFEPGDILVLRVGHVEAVLDLNDTTAEKAVRTYCGVAKNADVIKWHWDKGIAAVVTDAWVRFHRNRTPYDG
jgi:hypothetical protein